MNKVDITTRIAADPTEVFKALTRPKLLSRWLYAGGEGWSSEAQVELEEGGEIRITMISPEKDHYEHYGRFKEIRRPDRLVFTWNSPLLDHSIITIELTRVSGPGSMDSTTELRLIHEGLKDREQAEKHENAWHESLSHLENIFTETGKTRFAA